MAAGMVTPRMKPSLMLILGLIVLSGPLARPAAAEFEAEAARAQPAATPSPQPPGSASGPLLLPVIPTATPQSAVLPLVPEADCCTGVFWSPDSVWVAYVARPKGARAAGIYGAAVDGSGVRRLYSRVGLLSPDWSLMAYPDDGKTILMSTASGRKWVLPAAGKAVWFSPSKDRIIWETGSSTYAHLDLRRRAIWMANIDGSRALKAVTTYGGGFIGWTAAEANLLVSGRLSAYDPRGVWVIPLDASPPWLLFEADRIRDPLLSPDGAWLAFYLAFGADAAQDGLWLVKTDGSQQHHLPIFGAYRWRSGDQLLVIPQTMPPGELELLQVDAPSGESKRLTLAEPGLLISANDWQPSPDGRWLAYVSADGGGLMLAPLP